MSQRLPVNNFKWVKNISKFDKSSIKSYNEESDKEYFFEVDVQYHENVRNVHSYLLFLLGKMKIERVEKLVDSLHEKTEYVIHIRNLKQALDHRLVLRKLHRIINFEQKTWLKSYTDMNTDLRKKAKHDFEKILFELMQFLKKLWKM